MKKLWVEYKAIAGDVYQQEFSDFLIYRPLAFLLVKLLVRTPMTPNLVSFIALGFGVASGVFYSAGTTQGFFHGGLCLLAFSLLDCCDGMLARMKGLKDPFGELVDMFVDLVANIFIFFGLGKGVAQLAPGPVFPLGWMVAMGAFVIFIHASVYHYFRKQYQACLSNDPDARNKKLGYFRQELERLQAQNQSAFKQFVIRLFLSFSKLQSDHPEEVKLDCKRYCELNKYTLFGWGLLAGSNHLTAMALSTMLGGPNTYFVYALVFANSWLIVMWIIQNYINSKLAKGHRSQFA